MGHTGRGAPRVSVTDMGRSGPLRVPPVTLRAAGALLLMATLGPMNIVIIADLQAARVAIGHEAAVRLQTVGDLAELPS